VEAPLNKRSTNVVMLAARVSTAIALVWAAGGDGIAAAHRSCQQGDRGRLIGYEKVGAYPTPQDARAHFEEWIAFYQDFFNFPEDLPVTFDYGFDSYKVTYCTDDAVLPGQSVARTTTVTGMVSVPRKSGPLPTVAYPHGTSISFYDVPSNPNVFGDFNPRGESFEGPPSTAVFAGNGFIYIAPDYLGLGDSTVPRHRYFHAATEASSTIDLLAAAQKVLADLKVRQNGKLFVFGFSQGGHSALAVQRELERIRVNVEGTAVVGGIFDVEQWFLRSLENETTLFQPLYATYLLLAFDDMYDVYDSINEVFRRRYIPVIEEGFDMRHFFDDVAAELPLPARDLLRPGYYAQITTNNNDPMRVRLRENAVDRWRPEAPVRVYHSPVDEEVPYEDALVSVERLRRRGATISVRTLPGFDHVGSWIQAMPRAVRWFRTFE
jgi:pimeloyl-ACP methyl ester carboxylesterase